MIRSKWLFVLLAGLYLTACTNVTPIPQPEQVEPTVTAQMAQPEPTATLTAPFALTFMAGYKPQANLPFVGAYVAKEKGFFEEQNLDVTIEHSPGKGEHLQLLVAGKVQVTTMDAANVLQRRSDSQVPALSIALIGQRGQQAFAALAESGINTPTDWKGKNIGFKGSPTTDLLALLKANGLAETDVNLVNVGFDPRVLTEGQVDVYPVFKSNEPFLMKSWGKDVVLWDAADYDVPTLGLVYAASEQMVAEHPEELARFLAAVIKGIEYASENQQEAVDIVLKYAGPETDRGLMQYMLETELKDAVSVHGYGWQDQETWQALADSLTQFKTVENPIDTTSAFTTKIWELSANYKK